MLGVALTEGRGGVIGVPGNETDFEGVGEGVLSIMSAVQLPVSQHSQQLLQAYLEAPL